MMQYRQGDVGLMKVEGVPEDAEPVELDRGRVILAYGEATGHHHSFAASGGVELLEAPGGERFLTVESKAGLEHQEHDTIPVAPGTYRVIIQREYDDAEEFRRVLD